MQLTTYNTIFDYITSQESMYKRPIPINDSWSWSMHDHIKTSTLYINSQLINNSNRDFKPVKNITRPILNVQHRTEDIELTDVQLYVDDPAKYHLSFLVKKYHDDVFVRMYDLDAFFDDLNVSRIDYGAGLSKQLDKPCPEVVPLQSIAFCDQTDILSGPIGIKHHYSPDQLLEMEKVGWGKKENGATITLKELISLAREEKKNADDNNQKADTPGRYIEVYEVHGNVPKRFANPADESGEYETRLFICAFYQRKSGQEKQGVILYTALESETPFKIIKRDPVYGRALGFGGAEELFEAQVWVNYDMIRKQHMLDAASKTIIITQDPTFASKHPSGLKDVDNLEVLEEAPNANTRQLDTFPRNIKLFDESVEQWEAHAQQMGAANDSIMGESPASGTPFKLQELVTQESHGLHEYRRGQYAKHIEEIYQDWIIPHIQKQITKGAKFLSELSLEEAQYVMDAVVENEANKKVKQAMIEGELLGEEEIQMLKDVTRDTFKKRGNKHFIEILREDFKDSPLAVKVTVAGKSKNLAQRTDKLVNIFRTIAANPALLQSPAMASLWNQIIEASGLDPVDFSGFEAPVAPEPEQPQQPTAQMPMEPMAA